MSTKSQLLKGVLEGCILALIDRQPTYGYELFALLQDQGLSMVSEGSIYPILLRLQKEGLITGEMRKSSQGPNRKYYYLTALGKENLKTIQKEWEAIKKPVEQLLDGGEKENECQGNGECKQ
ncbi:MULTISPECIES: PadR family transcriptional regulator [Bacillaceae]|uniref:PadR family transcriptional regulator n=1 Tax=Bacillaceae TaxID=186817 RepID=UPI000E736ADD|nr:PadR family transcriptional regulator [Bacillus sp. PK3_68]RJS60960.1 PadR family transcriptional regulator [Bacillus sp. PK3_68]